MRRPYLLLPALLLLCSTTQADDGIQLDGFTLSGGAATGTCGPAQVHIQGVDAASSDTVSGLIPAEGVIIIRVDRASLTIGGEAARGIFLQDENKLHCLPTPRGPRLVLASYCFGRDCALVDYRVIDPATVGVVSEQTAAEECDEGCAERALGMALPADLREGP